MSPAWSPDGQWFAYVSFEQDIAAIYLQSTRTGERRRISARAGVNGSPSFSPDGKRMALTLSGSSGNLDVFVLDLATQALTRITEDPAIDTEAAWSPDGKFLYFMSDRGGAPQIYRAEVRERAPAKRITFGVAQAMRPRLSPDGTQLAMITREGGGDHVSVLDLASNQTRTLSRGSLDESPSFAPNGAQIIYAGRERGVGALATVSIDGQITQRLKSDQGEVRDPVWGPFTN
jgi:TolB protein